MKCLWIAPIVLHALIAPPQKDKCQLVIFKPPANLDNLEQKMMWIPSVHAYIYDHQTFGVTSTWRLFKPKEGKK